MRIRIAAKLAFRNVFRNPRRTVLTLLAISFGCAALIVNGGIIHYIFWGLREDAVYGRHGHIQIYREGYNKHHMSDPFRYRIPGEEAEALRKRLLGTEHVEHVTSRVEFSGVIVAGEKNIAFMGQGVEPDQEAFFSRQTSIIEGEPLSPEHPHGIILGKGLAEKLDAHTGDSVVLLANTADGIFNAVDATVLGIFQGGLKAFDDWVLKAPFPAVRELLWSDEVETVLVLLDRTERTEEIAELLRTRFLSTGGGLELRVWSDLALFHNQVVSLFQRELDIIKVIISVIVMLSIANTMTMSILERTREIGTLMAMGTKPGSVVQLFLLEALILGLLGGGLGILAGIGIGEVISAIGIPFPSPPGSTRPFLGKVMIVPSILWFSFLIPVASTLAAAILPAIRASRLRVVEALRQT